MNNRKRGAAGALIIVGVTLLFLGIAGYSSSIYRLGFVRSRLDSAVRSIAAVGSLNLLSPATICESMRDTFIGIFPDGGASLDLAADTELVLKLYFYSGLVGSGGQSSEYVVPKTGPCSLTGLYSLPIEKVKVELTAEVKLSAIAPVEHMFGGTKVTTTMSAQAYAQLAPLDVVLLLDNSNSVVAPAYSGSSTGFDDYEDVVGNSSGVVGTKKAIYAGACFGHVNRRIKEAAVKFYDVLTAVSSNRVAVAYTNPGWAEVAGFAVSLDQSPWTRPAAAEADDGQQIEYAKSPPGSIDSYSSRCASITDDYNLPAYPFASSWVSVSDFIPASGNLVDKLVCRGSCSDEADYNRFDPEKTGLLPREIIWSANAGLFTASGSLDPVGNVNIVESSLDHVYQELALNNYQIEDPELPGAMISPRKLVIYITDGVDLVPTSSVLPLANPNPPQRNTLYSPLVADGLVLPSGSISDFAAPSVSPTPIWAGMHENPCEVEMPNADDYSLGVVYLHHRIEDPDSISGLPAPFKISYYLPGHSYDDEDDLTPNALMSTWRTTCKSAVGPGRGTFFVESSVFIDPDDLVKEVVPAVIETLLLPSLR